MGKRFEIKLQYERLSEFSFEKLLSGVMSVRESQYERSSEVSCSSFPSGVMSDRE